MAEDQTIGDSSEYQLRVAFEDGSESYVNGFEAGGLWQRMQAGAEAEISMTVHTANIETLTRMAAAEGWSVNFTPTEYEEWTYLQMEKTVKAPERVNPYGLRVV